MTAAPSKDDCGGERAGRFAPRVEVSAEAATAREIRIRGSGGSLIPEGWQVAGDSGQAAWITGAEAIAAFGQPLYPGETTQAAPLWPSGNFAAVKDMGSCSPPVHG